MFGPWDQELIFPVTFRRMTPGLRSPSASEQMVLSMTSCTGRAESQWHWFLELATKVLEDRQPASRLPGQIAHQESPVARLPSWCILQVQSGKRTRPQFSSSHSTDVPGKACQAWGTHCVRDGVLAFGFLFVCLFIMEGAFCMCVVSTHVPVGIFPDHSPPSFSETGLSRNLKSISLARLAGQ